MLRGVDRKKETFFVVEDDGVSVRCAAQLLKERFTVVSAGSVREALAMLNDLARPAAVVIDGRLPDGKGAKVVARVHALYPEMQMLVQTGYPDDHELANLAQSIGAEYAVKPGGCIVSFARRVVIRQVLRDDVLARRTASVSVGRGLSLCQTEVLALAVTELAVPGIADRLGVSVSTVKAHGESIATKCGGRPLGAVAWGIRSGSAQDLAT